MSWPKKLDGRCEISKLFADIEDFFAEGAIFWNERLQAFWLNENRNRDNDASRKNKMADASEFFQSSWSTATTFVPFDLDETTNSDNDVGRKKRWPMRKSISNDCNQKWLSSFRN